MRERSDHRKRTLGLTVALLAAAITVKACAPPMRPTIPGPPDAALMAQLWVEPADPTSRDLFYGIGGKDLAPEPGASFTFLEADTTGFSRGYDVQDQDGLKWSVKTGPEAQPEVVASRLLWGLGYHQPPTYYLDRWTLIGAGADSGSKPPARFRPELPSQKKVGDWLWQQNPFVGTQPFKGLIVVNLMLNNSDLKASNNALYDLADEMDGARRWYVARDIGHSLGRTGRRWGTRNDPKGFVEHGFIQGVRGDRVFFEYYGFHRELLQHVTASDVHWIADRLNRLSDQQWRDAFRAAGYSELEAQPFLNRMREKIAQGLAVPASLAGN